MVSFYLFHSDGLLQEKVRLKLAFGPYLLTLGKKVCLGRIDAFKVVVTDSFKDASIYLSIHPSIHH